MRHAFGIVCLLLLVVTAAGSEEAPVEPSAAADEVLVAVRQGNNEALQRLARRALPDPWLVADTLLGRGEDDAAAAFAKQTEGKDVEQLPGYVAGRKGKPDDEASRKALAAWQAAYDARDEAAYRASLQGVQPDLSTVIGVYVAALQVLALRGRVEATALRDAASATADAALKLGWLFQAARVLHANAYVFYRNGQYRLADGQYEKALTIQERRGDAGAVAFTLHNLGNVQKGLGQLRKAERYYRRALALREQDGQPADIAASLIDLAALQLSLGDLRYARMLYRRGIEQAERAEQHTWLANALEGYAHVLSEDGAPARAREHHERALRLREKLGDQLAVASSLHNMAIVESELGHADEALGLFRRALEMRTELRHAPHVLQTLRALAQAHRRAGKLDRAFEAYEQARRIHRNMGDAGGALHARAMMGAIRAEQGAHDEARRALEAVANDARKSRDPLVATLAATELAALHLGADRPAEALAAAFAAIGAARAVGKELAERLFSVGAAAAVRVGVAEAAYTFLDAGRAEGLLQHVLARDALLAVALPEVLTREEAAARARVAAAASAVAGLPRGAPLRVRRDRQRDLQEAEIELRVALARIQAHARESVDLQYPTPQPLEVLQSHLRPDQAFVLYGTHEDEVLAVVVTGKGAKPYRLGTRAAMSKGAAVLAAAGETAAPRLAAQALRAQLVEPLGLADEVRQVLVVPCAELRRVPPALLFKRPVAVLPSASVFVALRNQARKPGHGVLAVGDPTAMAGAGRRRPALPAARAEAKAVGDVVLLREEATRARLLAALGERARWRALHIAGHAHIDTAHPEDTYLVLAPTKSAAGRLRPLDLERLDVSAELVVLSVDRSARGGPRAGEGRRGLPEAFLMAGARQVLASLRHVDDEATRALMEKFYELWNPKEGKGAGAAAALAAAQDFVRKQERWKHPLYWAGWVLYGLPD